jgi:hypothetical protein
MSWTRWGFLPMAALALAVSACTPAVATQSPSGSPATPVASAASAAATYADSASAASAAPSAPVTASPTLESASLPFHPAPATIPQRPPGPSSFNVTDKQGSVPCPSPDAASNCHTSDLAWQSSAASGTWFKIYEAWTGEGGASCQDAQADESVVITTKADAKTAQLYDQIAVGGEGRCLWITAVNKAGESDQVPAVGQ